MNIIETANRVKSRLDVKNVEFVRTSVFDINSDFIDFHNINAVFLHKTGGNFTKRQSRQMVSFIKSCGISTIISNISKKASKEDIDRMITSYYGGYKWKRIEHLLCIHK